MRCRELKAVWPLFARFNILDKISPTGDISKPSCRSKREQVIYRPPFGSMLIRPAQETASVDFTGAEWREATSSEYLHLAYAPRGEEERPAHPGAWRFTSA